MGSDYPPAALAAAAEAVNEVYAKRGWNKPAPWWVKEVSAAVLEAATPLLAEAWGLADLQAEHEAWQRIGERGRRLRDEFWRDVDARNPAPENVSSSTAATREAGEP